MSAPQEARHAVQAFMSGGNTALIGSFEAIQQIMFGPLKFDAHVRAFRAHEYYAEQKRRYARADAGVRAYLAEQGVRL